MPTGFSRKLSGLSVAFFLHLALGSEAVAQSPPLPCPVPPDSFLGKNALAEALDQPVKDLSDKMQALAKKYSQPESVRACFQLAELQAHQGFSSDFWARKQPSSSQPPAKNSCGWWSGMWPGQSYFLQSDELQKEERDCAGLRRGLLTQCLTLVVSESPACTVEAGSKRALDAILTSQLEDLCNDKTAAVPACSELLEKLKPKPSGYVETPQLRRARLTLSGVSFGVGAVALALGITQLFIPLGTWGSCPQNGLNYPCGPDRYGLGIPLSVGGGLLVAAGGILLAVKF